MAIQTRGKIKRCDHGELESQQQIVFRASGLLDQADSLLGAADLCLRAAGKTAEVRHLLSRVDAVADEADKLLERALVDEGDSARLIEEAFDSLPQGYELGFPPSHEDVRDLITGADARADEAQQLGDELPAGDVGAALSERIAQVRARASTLSGDLARVWNAEDSSGA
ncbi:hypothetical protein ACIG0A_17650 [Streptomyces californicus]|uniref:hypothetical protein n=1 Tax=Streptomyces californicus TaxID=67351 RepID=UPI0037D2541B